MYKISVDIVIRLRSSLSKAFVVSLILIMRIIEEQMFINQYFD